MANITIFNKDVFINNCKLTSSSLTPSKPLVLNSIKNINSASPNNTELSYLENLTSSFTSQYNNKVQLFDNSGNKLTNNPKILYGSLASANNIDVSFNPVFNTSPLVFANVNFNSVGGVGRIVQISNVTSNGFSINVINQAGNNVGSTTPVNWVAIGS